MIKNNPFPIIFADRLPRMSLIFLVVLGENNKGNRILACTGPYAQQNTGDHRFSPVHVYPKINTYSANFVQKCEGYPIQRQYTHIKKET